MLFDNAAHHKITCHGDSINIVAFNGGLVCLTVFDADSKKAATALIETAQWEKLIKCEAKRMGMIK